MVGLWSLMTEVKKIEKGKKFFSFLFKLLIWNFSLDLFNAFNFFFFYGFNFSQIIWTCC